MAQGVRKLVAVAGIGREVDSLEQLFGEMSERGAHAVAVVGDLGAPVKRGEHAPGSGVKPTSNQGGS